MRIAYRNLLDQLPSAQVVPSTETVLYEAVNVQDQRLEGTQWWTTSPTSQTIIFGASTDTIVGGNIGLVTGSSVTNLVTDPEDMESGNWSDTNATISAADNIVGYPAFKVLADSASAAYVQSANILSTTSQQTITVTARLGSGSDGRIVLLNASTVSNIFQAEIAFATKVITYTTGAASMPAQWIDDDTVRVFGEAVGSSVGNVMQTLLYADKDAGDAEYVIYSAPMVIDNTYPVPYVATSRTVISTQTSYRMPPSGKFIVDMEFKPFFPFDTPASPPIFGWYIDAAHHLWSRYNASTDAYRVFWQDGGTQRFLTSSAFTVLGSNTRMTLSLDLTTGNTTGPALYIDNALEDSAWNDAADVLASSGFTVLGIGQLNATYFDGIFRRFRVYGGIFPDTYTTEAEVDTELAKHELLLDQTYQEQFNFDTVAIMGHNISEGAAITFEANDWDEWNYTDGSSSSIIQHTLAWDDETILKMITKTKKTYAKFTINDPNNDAAQLKIGRIWLGPYIDIDPSSLDDFKVVKKRSDRNQYSRNRNKWSDKGVGWRRFELTFPRSGTTMIEKIQTMYDFSGNHSSMIFMNFDTLREYRIVSPVYCSIDGDVGFGHRGRQKYVYGLALEEDR